MEFSFKPKVTGAGSFTPPPGYQLINDEWVNTADVFEKSITTTCSIKENDMNEQQSTPECSGDAEAATTTTTESACSATAATESACSATAEVNVEAAESTGCSETTTETATESTETATAESTETAEESTEESTE